MGIFKKILDLLEKITIWATIFTFIVMITMGILQVLFRYVFESSLYFTEELARFMFVWAVFLASAVCLRRQSHAAIELFVSWLPVKIKKLVLVVSSICTISFLLIVFLKGIELTIATWEQASPALEISMGTIYLAIPVGGFLMLIYSFESIYALMKEQPSPGDVEGKVK